MHNMGIAQSHTNSKQCIPSCVHGRRTALPPKIVKTLHKKTSKHILEKYAKFVTKVFRLCIKVVSSAKYDTAANNDNVTQL